MHLSQELSVSFASARMSRGPRGDMGDMGEGNMVRVGGGLESDGKDSEDSRAEPSLRKGPGRGKEHGGRVSKTSRRGRKRSEGEGGQGKWNGNAGQVDRPNGVVPHQQSQARGCAASVAEFRWLRALLPV
jgi:hypothetical protein